MSEKKKAGRPMKTADKCLVEGCDLKSDARGLCTACYGRAARMVKDRSTTWEELESLGLCLSKENRLRRNDAKFYQALDKARAKLKKEPDVTGSVDGSIPAE